MSGDVILRVTEYRFTLLPEDHPEGDTWAVYVRWRGGESWSVDNASSCLGADGEWDLAGTGRFIAAAAGRDAWFAAHRFDLDVAMRLAVEVLPTIQWNGKTAADVAGEGRWCK